ncbi:glycoside hydrolase family 32 protein [Jiangella aurantiaca]|uniref:beta-fructofuranosidase n=1 Tax=Jiangella aurantiaca TaxID=2530373 RepID=A0A4R5AKA2_9ACTN|nr:glycoside hydrolase family 32 protein [Jiangella aurantiaca]TDD73073.1 glycoside hydrolase family 32 protein [Jiangella aurantiaca]
MTHRAPAPADVAAAPGHWRPRYHITGVRNWINDPNGPIHLDGRYHLFFQANPHAPAWGPPHWGHVSSPDLVHWTRHRTALAPENGRPDADGCWSGCLRIIDGRPVIYYTGVVGEDDDRVESVCRARGSADLLTWEKDPAGPLLPGPPTELGSGFHRDPFLWQDGSRWQLLLGSGTTAGERHGQVLRYESPDGSQWRYRGVFFAAPRRIDGLDLGELWECPQLVASGSSTALVVSCQVPDAPRPLMHAVGFVGSIVDGRFQGAPAGLLDHGDVFYAPALTTDAAGRTLLWGWAQEVVPPSTQATMGHVGALTVPRRLTVGDGRLEQEPVPELAALRLAPVGAADAPVEPALELAGAPVDDGWTVTDDVARLRIRAADSGGSLVVEVADPVGGERAFTLRRAAGNQVRVFVDGSLVEVFSDGAALTTRTYWARPRVRVSAPRRSDLRVWQLDGAVVR